MAPKKIPKPPQRTTPGFAFSILDRALRECLADRKFGADEITVVCGVFGGEELECAFCGSKEVKRWDHLVPVKLGGDTVLGNMVPACSRCDDSKRDLPYEPWMRGSSEGSPASRGVKDLDERSRRLGEYQVRFKYNPKDTDARLSPEGKKSLSAIRSEMASLRMKFDDLIAIHRGLKEGQPNSDTKCDCRSKPV